MWQTRWYDQDSMIYHFEMTSLPMLTELAELVPIKKIGETSPFWDPIWKLNVFYN